MSHVLPLGCCLQVWNRTEILANLRLRALDLPSSAERRTRNGNRSDLERLRVFVPERDALFLQLPKAVVNSMRTDDGKGMGAARAKIDGQISMDKVNPFA